MFFIFTKNSANNDFSPTRTNGKGTKRPAAAAHPKTKKRAPAFIYNQFISRYRTLSISAIKSSKGSPGRLFPFATTWRRHVFHHQTAIPRAQPLTKVLSSLIIQLL
eukprot:GHVP01068717.1.p1 GENE.GHVP01068717.1~~GHVP01068717.1.p1  ORF type:complete len:106 (+),score=2.92 GHVP01068717.1:285-602(+)